ncbi:hypothetical protein KUTeg_017481 [Tegillarca granosa]|uniref:Uncharacterized protein n=1 Tax=Tegillarca granosa TaxID=220873 RepID=A0ABQ9EKY0_TEGGR|nr:hypothetical protein KUTeg_017481 [Tegillarca granosa]
MLAGNNIKYDEIYSEPYDVTVLRHRPPQQQDVDSSALSNARNSQTRKAFKQHKTSTSYNDSQLYSEPVEMGNNEGHPSSDLTGDVNNLPGEHDGCFDQPRKKSVEGKRKNSSRKELCTIFVYIHKSFPTMYTVNKICKNDKK